MVAKMNPKLSPGCRILWGVWYLMWVCYVVQFTVGVSAARSRNVSSVWHMPAGQEEGPLPSHCRCGRRWRRTGSPSIEKPLVKEQGLWAR